jgi:Protein of unknown function (DUF3006)
VIKMSNKKICILDRIEGEWAIVEFGRLTFDIPAGLIPKDAKEGDTLEVNILVNQENTDERKAKIDDLASRLFKK